MCCMIGINYKTHNCVHKPVFFSVIFSKNSNLFMGFTLRSKTQILVSFSKTPKKPLVLISIIYPTEYIESDSNIMLNKVMYVKQVIYHSMFITILHDSKVIDKIILYHIQSNTTMHLFSKSYYSRGRKKLDINCLVMDKAMLYSVLLNSVSLI